MTHDERLRAAARTVAMISEGDFACHDEYEDEIFAALTRHFPPVDVGALADEIAERWGVHKCVVLEIINKHLGAGASE